MELSLHHLAHVVKNIQEKYEFYTNLGYTIVEGFDKPKADHEQKVIVGVIQKDNLVIELLEPLNETSPIYTFLQKGGGFHHLCYDVPNLDDGIRYMKKFTRQLTPITKSVWDQRPVVFFIGNDGEIIELIG